MVVEHIGEEVESGVILHWWWSKEEKRGTGSGVTKWRALEQQQNGVVVLLRVEVK